MRVEKVSEFEDWFDSLEKRTKAQVEARITRIELHEHFGDAKSLDDGLAELKWKSGLRVYFTSAVDSKGRLVLLLLGGHKNAQKKDIKKARKLLEKYEDHET